MGTNADRYWPDHALPSRLYPRSGGVFGPDGLIYATGHHAPEIHVLRLPKAGAFLEFVRVIQSPVEGQGLALDVPGKKLLQMQRKERSIYEFDLTPALR